jgi:AraC-like DNA-binding protein
MNMQFWSVVLFFGIAQGALLALALFFNPRGRRSANILLSLMLVSSMANLLPWWLGVMGWIERAPYVMHVAIVLSPMIVPLYYFYTKALLRPEHRTKVYLVAIAALLPGALRLLELSMQCMHADCVVARVNSLVQGEILTATPNQLLSPIAHTIYWVLFIYLAWRLIKRTGKSLLNEYANGARRHMIWLKALTVGLCVITANAVAMFAIILTTGKYTIATEITFSLIRCLFIQSVAVAALLLPEGFSATLAELVSRPRRVSVDEDTAEEHKRGLLDYMDREKPFRDENLRLADLAGNLEIPAYVLSQLINDRLGVNFFDFINKYRVEEAQSLLKREESDRFTLVAIAGEAGFNSKASFNRAFNKHAGMSPSRYRVLCKG